MCTSKLVLIDNSQERKDKSLFGFHIPLSYESQYGDLYVTDNSFTCSFETHATLKLVSEMSRF